MQNIVDIAVLDTDGSAAGAVWARSDGDIAIARLPFDAEFQRLDDFCTTIREVLLRNKQRPAKQALTGFGHKLFEFVMRDEVRKLYERLPAGALVRFHLMTNSPRIQRLAWEYLQDPGQPPGPWRERSIVRVVPSVGRPPVIPVDLSTPGRKLRILFVFADPANLDPVSWPSVRASVQNSLASRLPVDRFEVEVIEGTPDGLLRALEKASVTYDIFHFSGHGDVDSAGMGRLLLVDNNNGGDPAPLGADDLAALLAGKGFTLAVLSACMTAAGNAAEPFNITAEALVRSGFPAVVANQFPVPDASVAAFTGTLYSNLVDSGDIDRAVNEGRIRLAVELATKGTVLEWGIPTLYRRVSATQLLSVGG